MCSLALVVSCSDPLFNGQYSRFNNISIKIARYIYEYEIAPIDRPIPPHNSQYVHREGAVIQSPPYPREVKA